MTLHAGDLMPLFTVTSSLTGHPFAYRDVWQRKNLVLVSIPQADSTGSPYVAALLARAGDLQSDDVQMIVTGDIVAGMPSPGVAVADRWGEIYFVQGASLASGLPAADDLVEWIRHVQTICPECQGETR